MATNVWYCRKCEKDFTTKRKIGELQPIPKCPYCKSEEVEWVGFSTKFAVK